MMPTTPAKIPLRARPSVHRRRRIVAVVGAAALTLAACGGSDDSSDSSSGDGDDSVVEIDPGSDADLDVGDVTDDAVDGLDEGQLDILDDVAEGLEDEFGDDESEGAAPWAGIRLVSASAAAQLDTIDPDAFSGVSKTFATPIPDPLGNLEQGNILLDSEVVVGDSMWVSARTGLHQVSLADGAITATIPIDEVLPGGEFGDITGDENGVFVLATLVGGGDVVAEVDPATATLRTAHDMSVDVTSLLTIASNDTHVAAAYKDAPGIPVKLIERSSGTVTDVGNYLKIHQVQIVRDELWVIVGSSKTTEPDTYEKFSLDGTSIGGGTLPMIGQVRTFGDRIVAISADNAADPSNPIMPIEIEPQGTPIEALLPEGMVTLSAYAEIDGYAVSSGGCCLVDDGGFPLRTAIIDIASGEVVHTADSLTARTILPPA